MSMRRSCAQRTCGVEVSKRCSNGIGADDGSAAHHQGVGRLERSFRISIIKSTETAMNRFLLATTMVLALAGTGIAQAQNADSMAKPDTMSHSTMTHSTMSHSTMKHHTMKHIMTKPNMMKRNAMKHDTMSHTAQ